MIGIVIKSTGSRYRVIADGKIYDCGLKGKIRMEGRKTTNPIAVGDQVEFDFEDKGEAVIFHILPRKNYIIRKSINLSKQAQIVASNLDQAVLLATLISPRTSLGFIDRFLITAEAYGITAKIIFNKCDLLDEALLEIQKQTINIYTKVGYECFQVSSFNQIEVDQLRNLFKDKTTLVAGHSGVGKSTFVNALQPGLNIKT